MQLVSLTKPPATAEDHFRRALGFYAAHGQAESPIAQLTAGMLAMAEQLTRVERALPAARVP